MHGRESGVSPLLSRGLRDVVILVQERRGKALLWDQNAFSHLDELFAVRESRFLPDFTGDCVIVWTGVAIHNNRG